MLSKHGLGVVVRVWERWVQGFLGWYCIIDRYTFLSVPVWACGFPGDLSGKQMIPSASWWCNNCLIQKPFRVLEGGYRAGNGEKTCFNSGIYLHSDKMVSLVPVASSLGTHLAAPGYPGLGDLPAWDCVDFFPLPRLHI